MTSLLQGHTRSEEESHRSPCLDPDVSLMDNEAKRGGGLQANQFLWAGRAAMAQLASLPVHAARHPCAWPVGSEARSLITWLSSYQA